MTAWDPAPFAQWVWRDTGSAARAVRGLLVPASSVFGQVVRRRNRRFDRAWSHADSPISPTMPVPALSVGNLTVGGTGKTPVASWFTSAFLQRGASPAIVMRGYGDDEWRVHQLLTPSAQVVCDPDRVRGAQIARERGADVVVLDDAFQHRRARRVADVVLLSADQWDPSVRLLPAGPYREGLGALQRATCVVVTVKSERGGAAVEPLIARITDAAPHVPIAVVRIVPDQLHRFATGATGDGAQETLTAARATRWGIVSGIGDPAAFEAQLAAAGLVVDRTRRFPDHHRYTATDAAQLVRDFKGLDGVLCTLKDAVKLGPLWPPGALPLWYVSQTLVVERGAAVLVEQVDRVLSARSTTIPTSG